MNAACKVLRNAVDEERNTALGLRSDASAPLALAGNAFLARGP